MKHEQFPNQLEYSLQLALRNQLDDQIDHNRTDSPITDLWFKLAYQINYGLGQILYFEIRKER